MNEQYMERAFSLDDLCRSIVMRYAETARRFEEGVRRMPELSASLQKGRTESRSIHDSEKKCRIHRF